MNINNIFLHTLIKISRTWTFETEVLSTIFDLLRWVFVLANFVAFGFLFDILFKNYEGNINSILLAVFFGIGILEIILKITLEKKLFFNINPYITLPIKLWKLKIHNFIANLFKISNFLNFTFFTSYFLKQIIFNNYSVLNAFIFIILIFGLELFNECLINLFKSFNGLKSIFCIIIYIAFYLAILSFGLSYLLYINQLTIVFSILLFYGLSWIFHSLQFNKERINFIENKTSSKIKRLNFSNISIYGQLILKNVLRGKNVKNYIFLLLTSILFIIQSYIGFENHIFMKSFSLSYGLLILFYWFSLVSEPIFSYFSCYSDGLISREPNFYNNLLHNHYKIHLIYSSIIAIILIAVTQRFWLITTMYMLNITKFYFISTFQNVVGGVYRINVMDSTSRKMTFSIPALLFIIISTIFSLLCVYFEKNIYFNISIIVICFIFFLKRNSYFSFLSNKFKENRYKNHAIYRGEVN